MIGYESIMLFCAVGTLVVTIASFVLELVKALAKRKDKSK